MSALTDRLDATIRAMGELHTQHLALLAELRAYVASQPEPVAAPKPLSERTHYGVPEVAAMMGVSKAEIYRRCRRHEIAHIRMGRRVVVTAAAIERYWQELEEAS